MDEFKILKPILPDHPRLIGNGFDGLIIGDNIDEAKKFVDYLNEQMKFPASYLLEKQRK